MSDIYWGRTDVDRKRLEGELDFERLQSQTSGNFEVKFSVFLDSIVSDIQKLPEEGRKFPWRKNIEVWKIYYTEILLRKTRGESVEKAYDEFFERIDSPEKIREIDEQELKDLVRSLGLVEKRVETLREASELIEENSGLVPKEREKLLSIWGAGRYVANATLLFGHGSTAELVDTNTYSYISEAFDLEYNIPHKSEEFREIMRDMTPEDPELARAYYLAMLDFGFTLGDS